MRMTILGSAGSIMPVRWLKTLTAGIAAVTFVAGSAVPAIAQVTTVDPDAAIDADINHGASSPAPSTSAYPSGAAAGNGTPMGESSSAPAGGVADWGPESVGAVSPDGTVTPTENKTYKKDDLIGAAEGVFGKGAEGLAGIIEDLLRKQGEPNAYIVGREGGGAVAFGLRYGSGTMFHKVEGQMPVYWTGPSLGFDLGLNASKAFVLVYNLYDSADLFHRFGAGEGQAYLVGGFTVSYLKRGNVVLIPVRSGAGLRLGANLGYMKFSHKQKWLPF